MTGKLFIVFCIILIIIGISMYINKNCRENFNEGTTSLGNMFNELDDWEKICNDIETNIQNKNEINKIKQNEIAFNQLEELDKKIYELKEIVKDLTIDKKRRDGINEKCQENAQIKLNKNYDIVNNLNNKGLVDKQNIDLDFNISDSLDFSGLNKNKTNIIKGKKCDVKNSKDYINIDKTNISDKCYNCYSNKIKDNLPHILNDFK
jgi:hypothetical protein